MQNTGVKTGWLLVVLIMAGAALSACKDKEILEACSKLCEERIACEEEEDGNSVTDPGGCQTACIGIKGNDFIEKAEACEATSSCDYEACIEE